ncbi:MAG: acyl carrier protein [Proteobacteria bacterium]|nr:acyl carrier protein [Pseudomonadota bacterium]
MIPNNDIKKTVCTFLNRHIKNHEFQGDEAIFTSALFNSLFAMQLVLFLEKEYRIKVENEDLDLSNFNTLNAISAFVEQKASCDCHEH